MAGSYHHCVDDQGRLREPSDLCGMLECSSGDVYEAAEEMYGMIWYLAEQIRRSTFDPMAPMSDVEWRASSVEEARQHYQEGLEFSPGLLAGETVTEVVRRQMRGE